MQRNSKKILLVDDNKAIHEDFKKIFQKKSRDELEEAESKLFNRQITENSETKYTIDSAYQGEAGLEAVQKAIASNEPYALAFIDVRMPPGWDGIETIKKIWEVDANIQIVICTAFADYTWQEISHELYDSDNFLILKKPFDINEIRQLVAALTKKWELRHEVQYQLDNLKTLVEEKTADLELSLSLTKATLESTPEGIVVIGNHTLSMFNKVFLSMWNVQSEDIENKSADIVFQMMADQVEDGNAFLEMLLQLSANPSIARNLNAWRLKSGQIYELDAKPQYLHEKVIGFVLSSRDVTHSKNLEEKLLYQSTHDSLTELPNRVLLRDRIADAIKNAQQKNIQLGVLLVDLDNFKMINDRFGHAAGDELLKQIGVRLNEATTKNDTVVRLGGDEFVVLLTSPERVEDVITKAKELLQKFSTPIQIEDHTLAISISIGISYYPDDGEDANTLLKCADAALYHAKKLGKNTFQVYMSEYNQQLLRRAELNSALIQALGKDQFILNSQPIFNIHSNKIIGFEILLRWQHPTLGVIFPDKFITLAEETGLIAPIGEWVLNEACKLIKVWQQNYDAELFVAVNISGYQFLQKNFVSIVKKAIEDAHIVPKTLELELTENIAFATDSMSLQKLKDLKALGVQLSIDDFGMGHLSFAYQRWLPFHKVKIDKSFIKEIQTNKHNKTFVKAIIEMTHHLGIEILAEGVEKEEQLNFLLEHKVNQAQGYFLSPPVSIAACEKLLTEQQLIHEKME